MVKVICIDDSENNNVVTGKLITIGKIYDAYIADDFSDDSNIPFPDLFHKEFGRQCPYNSYYMIADDGYPVIITRDYFKILREINLDILLD
jgi:hypothetical protein